LQISSIGAGDSVKAIDDRVCVQLASITPKTNLIVDELSVLKYCTKEGFGYV